MKSLKVFLLLCVFALCLHITAKADNPPEGIDGFWQTEGYGYVIEIKNSKAKRVFDISDIHALKVKFGAMFINYEMTFELRNDGKLLVKRPEKIGYYVCRRLNELPEHCKKWRKYRSKDPVKNFEVFWQNMKEHYAFFEQRGIDWEQIKAQYSAKVTSETSAEQLFAILIEICSKFNDTHLALDGERWWMHPNFKDKYLLEKEDIVDYQISKVKKWTSGTVGKNWEKYGYHEIFPVIKSHLTDGNKSGRGYDFKRTGNGKILYGKMGEKTGYVTVLEQGGFYFGEESKNPVVQSKREMNSYHKCLDTLVSYFEGIDKLVVDLRFNTGGDDTYGLLLASRFADEKKLAFSKKALHGNSFSQEIYCYLEPEYRKCLKVNEIKLLTSKNTISAAETFALSFRPLKQTQIIGEATNGSLSDMLDKQLPNGWSFSLSNEVYTSHDGICFEGKGEFGTGIKPDVEIPFRISDFLEHKKDPILEAALNK